MDKLKAQLAPVAKHWFWITTALVLLGSFGIWWMASGTLVSEFESARSQIEGNASKVTGVSSKISEHPNAKTHAEMEKLIEARKQAVLNSWNSVYSRQQDILVWPVAELQEDFVSEFRELTPIELKVPFPTPEEQEKETTLLNRYRYYIPAVLPGIAAIAKTEWTAKFDAIGGGMGGGSYEDSAAMGYPNATGLVKEGPLVKWDTASQEALLTDLFPWRQKGQPNTLEVLYSQENLWILRQLMEIIANVNGDAGQRFQAKIHDINRIAIGSSVSTTAGFVSKPTNEAAGMMGMDMSGMDMGAEMSGLEMGPPEGMGGPMAVAVDPGDNRYVDTTGKPLLASQLRSALASNSPTDAFMAVAKRIPVMMSFKMDQRAIPELIAKCGSARLMVEVRQVRILPLGKSSAAGYGAGGADYGGGIDSGGMDGGGYGSGIDSGGYGGGMDMGMGTPGGTATEQFPLDLDVEIYGIIYIYNPPLEEKLGIEAVTEETLNEVTAILDGRKGEADSAAAVEALPAPDTSTAAGAATGASEPPAVGALPAVPSPPASVPPAAGASPPAGPVVPPVEEPLPAPGAAATPAAAAGARWIPAKSSLNPSLRIG